MLLASGGVDEIDRLELLRGPSVGIAPVLIRYRVIFSRAEVMASSLFGARTSSWASCIPVCRLTSFLTETLLRSLRRISAWMTPTRITAHIPVR